MPWVPLKPHSIVSLADSLPLCRTDAARAWAAAYADLLAAQGGAVPPKSALDVTKIPGVVPHLVLCAVTLPDRCIYRVVGEEVKARVGRNLVGLNYYDLVPAERRASAQATMAMVTGVPCGFRVEMEQSYSNGVCRLVEGAAFPLAAGPANGGMDGFVLIADCEIEDAEGEGGGDGGAGHQGGARRPVDLSGVTLLGTNILRRDLIDIGFGVDPDFVDLVPPTD